MIQAVASDKDLRAHLRSGAIRCDWIKPHTKPDAISVILDEPSMEGLRSCLPALKDTSVEEFVQAIDDKIQAGDRYLTNRGIAHDPRNLPATFEVQESIHCEAALIAYLDDQAIESTLYIASALPACYACHLLAISMREVQGCNSFRLGPYERRHRLRMGVSRTSTCRRAGEDHAH